MIALLRDLFFAWREVRKLRRQLDEARLEASKGPEQLTLF